MQEVPVKNFLIGQGHPLTLICGPCIIESEEHCLFCADFLKNLCDKLPLNLIFKASYDKANRSSISSFRGPGLEKGLRILEKVKTNFDLPVLTDVHSPEEARMAGAVCEVIQIPAFLCRQTDLVLAAGETGAVINVKKGQFLAPWDMSNVVDKLHSTNNQKIILTDRGTCFGYNNLVSDMRTIPLMQKLGYPVCFDASHSAQLPGGLGHATGGQREFIPMLARASIAAGANALFIEAHPHPKEAKSDAATVWSFDELPALLDSVLRLYEAMKP